MEKFVEGLKKLVRFKDTLETGDIVVIAALNPQMLLYGLVEDIVRDETKRDEWWHVSMQILSLPPQKATWILRTEQMTGLEIFTMDGKERFMKAVDFSKNTPPPEQKKQKKDNHKPALRRVK